MHSQLMTMFSNTFSLSKSQKANISEINHQYYNKCPKCPPSAFTQAPRRFLTFAIDLKISSCCESFQIFISANLQFRDVLRLRIQIRELLKFSSTDPQTWRSSGLMYVLFGGNDFSVYDTIWYGRLTCAQKLTGWPAYSSARPRNEK